MRTAGSGRYDLAESFQARSGLIQANARSEEQHASLIENETLRRLPGSIGMESWSGVLVNAEMALTVSAVYSCVRVLAEAVATLPLFVYRRTADGGKSRESKHPLYDRLHDVPNDWQTSMEWREMMTGTPDSSRKRLFLPGRSWKW